MIITDILRSHRLRRWIFVTVGGFALLLVCGFALLIALGMYVRAHNPTIRARAGVDSAIATEPVTIPMGNVVLRIPRNYIMAGPSHDIQGTPDGVEFVLLGLLPDFEPRTDANRAEFSNFHGFGRKLNVLVSYKKFTATGKDLFRIVYESKARRPDTGEMYSARSPVIDDEFGYKSFSSGGFDHLFHGSVDDPKDLISCSSRIHPIVVYQSCARTILAGEQIIIEFEFSRDYLGSEHDIEQQVIMVLNRFRISGQPLRVIQ